MTLNKLFIAGSVVTKHTTASIRLEYTVLGVVWRLFVLCDWFPRSHVIDALGVLKAECGTSTALPDFLRLQQNVDVHADHVGNVLTASSNPLSANMLNNGFLVDGIWSII